MWFGNNCVPFTRLETGSHADESGHQLEVLGRARAGTRGSCCHCDDGGGNGTKKGIYEARVGSASCDVGGTELAVK